MAGADAVHGTGSLLLRALAIGGLTAAGWLLTSAVASASPSDHPDAAPTATDTVNTATAMVQEHEETVALLDSLLSGRTPWKAVLNSTVFSLPGTNGEPGTGSSTYAAPETEPTGQAILPAPESAATEEEPSSSYSGGSHSSSVRSGSTSNTMPEELYTAKVAAKEVAKAAAAQPAPAPAVVPAPTSMTSMVIPRRVEPATVATVPIEDVDVQSYSGLEWEIPGPVVPVRAPTAPTASSSSPDQSGGARGAPVAVIAQSLPLPPTSWSVERRDDGRTPGSTSGLPSTSPD